MTPELQRAMARYEEARIQYRKALIASRDGAPQGAAIREAIREVQRASAELKRHRPEPPPSPVVAAQNEPREVTSWRVLLPFLKAS
jgi:hypothetical protein